VKDLAVEHIPGSPSLHIKVKVSTSSRYTHDATHWQSPVNLLPLLYLEIWTV
jgi:hypothetical protein